MKKYSKAHRYSAISLLIFALLWGCAPKKMETVKLDNGKNLIERLETREIDGITRITIAAEDPITYTTFKLVDPVRIVIDINEADLSKLEKELPVNNGAVNNIILTQFGEDELNIGRIEIFLSELTDYNIEKDGEVLSVDIQNLAEEESVAEEIIESAPVEAVAEAVYEKKPPERSYSEKAKYIADLAVEENDDSARIIITGDGYIGDYNAFNLSDPPRIVTDVMGVQNLFRKNSLNIENQMLKTVRIGQHPDKVRLVVDLPEGASSRFTTSKSGNKLMITLGEAMVSEKAAVEIPEGAVHGDEGIVEEFPPTAAAIQENGTEAVSEVGGGEKIPSPVESLKIAGITGVDFGQRPDFSRVTISSDNPFSYEVKTSSGEKLVLDISNARVPKSLQRSLDTSEFDSPIQMISSYQLKKGKENVVRIVVLLRQDADHELIREEDKLIIDFKRNTEEESAPGEVVAQVLEKPERPDSAELHENTEEPVDAATETVSVETAEEAPTEKTRVGVEDEKSGKKYVGQHVSLDYKDADIGNILRLFAEISNLNIIATEDVKGTVTIKLDDVPWDQAMDIVLEAKGLGMTKIGNVIRIAPAAKLKQEEDADLARKKAMAKLEDLVVEIVPINYADAAEMSNKIKDILSDRGTVTVDKRTNVLIVKDIDKKVKQAGELVKLLDKAAPQVLIEARIVEIDTNYSKELGVQWGSGYSADAAHGNPTGLSFPNSIGIGMGGGGGFVLDPPTIGASVGSGTGTGKLRDAGGSIGFNFGSIGNTLSLDLKLSALETRGVSKIISRPRIVTMDNSQAVIEQGFSIPFDTTSQFGTKTEFIDANLNLTVTPHITADGSVIMKLKIAKNEPDFARQGSGGAPSIVKKEASTEVLIADGDTTVIGGIFTHKKGDSSAGIPFLSRLPLIGWLFKSKDTNDDKAELLVFVTPRILKGKQ